MEKKSDKNPSCVIIGPLENTRDVCFEFKNSNKSLF